MCSSQGFSYTHKGLDPISGLIISLATPAVTYQLRTHAQRNVYSPSGITPVRHELIPLWHTLLGHALNGNENKLVNSHNS